MRKTRFVIDTNEQTYEGYTDGRRWNGWECPWFTKEVADEIMKALNNEDIRAEYDSKKDSYLVYFDDDADGPYEFDGADVKTEDGSMHLYPVGAWCWIWDEVVEEE